MENNVQDGQAFAQLAHLAEHHGVGDEPLIIGAAHPPVGNPFHAALQLNLAAVEFVSAIFQRVVDTQFPTPQNAQNLPPVQQQFYAGVARVTRAQFHNQDYFMLPFGVAAGAVVSFSFLASYDIWGLFLVVAINNGSVSCRYLGQVGGVAGDSGPLQLYQHITFLPPSHFLRPGVGYVVAFNQLIQAFQLHEQPPVPVAPMVAAPGAFDQAALALLNNQRQPAAPTGATVADNFRIAQGTLHFFDDPARHRAFYFPDKADDEVPTASDLRHNTSLQSARDTFRGPDQLNPKHPDLADKQVHGLMSFDFGTGHAGKVSLADIHSKDVTVNSPTQLMHSFTLLIGFCSRWFGPSAAAGVQQLCTSLMALINAYPQLRVDEVIALGDMQLKAVSTSFPTTRDLRDVFVEGLTIHQNDPRVLHCLVSRHHSPPAGGRNSSRSSGRGHPVKSGRNRFYSSAKSGQYGSVSEGPPPLVSVHKTSYQEWNAGKPSLNNGAEPCYNHILGIGPCANSAQCVGSGPKKVKRPHAYPPEATAAQQSAFTAWLHTRPSAKLYTKVYDLPSEVLDLASILQRCWGTSVTPVSISQLYPSLSAAASFQDVVAAARIYLDVEVQRVAAETARSLVAADPASRIDQRLIAAHRAAAAPPTASEPSRLLALIQRMSAELLPVTYQPNFKLPPDPAPHSRSIPPLPDITAADGRFAELAAGSSVLLHSTFRPTTALPPAPGEPDVALAIELLARKDHAAGRCLILPALDAITWATAEQLPLHLSYAFIVRKTDYPLGRLVIDYSRQGPNHPDKKASLAAEWGPITYPRIPDYCATLLATAQRYPGVRLVGVKTDFDAWYKHIRVSARATPLLAYVIYLDGYPYVVIPLTEVFGSQDSNYHSNFGGSCIYAHMRARAWARFGGDVGHLYSDDHVEWVPEPSATTELSAIASIADAAAGARTIQLNKTEIGPVVDCIGARFDSDRLVVSPTSTLFLKLICLFFLETPKSLTAGLLVSVAWLQRLSSYMILASDFIVPLRPFSRGPAHNTAGRESRRSVPLEPNTLIDILFWRAVLLYSCYDASWLIQPVAIPPLFRELPDESPEDRCRRQSETADYLVYSDACKDTHRRGIGFVITDLDGKLLLWGGHMLPPGFIDSADINVLECLAAVLALDASTTLPHSYTHNEPIHIHQFSDNTSALTFIPLADTTQVCGDQSSHKRRAQRPGRCHQSGLRLPQWEPILPDPLDRASPALAARLDGHLGGHVTNAVLGHLEDSSRRTYGTGWRHFQNFCMTFLVPLTFFTSPPAACARLLEFFLAYLRELALSGRTIDQYLSHVLTTLKEKGLHLRTPDLRSPRSTFMISGWIKDDRFALPERLKAKIPMSAPVLVHVLHLIHSIFSDTTLGRLLSAAFCLGYGAAFRPCEYLTDASGTPGSHTLTGSLCFFQWIGSPNFFSVTNPALFPPGYPSHFVALLDSSKHDPLGHGGPRAIARAPLNASFCCLARLFTYLRQYPPTPSAPLLSGANLPLAPAALNKILKVTAVKLGLDPHRLVPHSLRVGSVCQLEGLPVESLLRHTGHASPKGLYAYCRASLEHATTVAPMLHDTERLSLPFLRLTYMTPPREDA